MDEPRDDSPERRSHIAKLLPANRAAEPVNWGEISYLEGKPCTKKLANKFLVCCLLDYRIDSDLAWRNGYRLVEELLGDPDDVWQAITSVSDGDWKSKRDEYNSIAFPPAITACAGSEGASATNMKATQGFGDGA